MEEMKDKPGKDLWLMMNESQLTQENFFTSDVALDHEGVMGPLVRLKPAMPDDTSQSNRPHAASPVVA